MLRDWFEKQWQYRGRGQWLLLPFSWIFALLTSLRRHLYHTGLLTSQPLPVPVIVVGNISVGGVGKTPLVIYLAQALQAAGYRPGILSRGYGGKQTGEVLPDSDPELLGDEPVLMARRLGCPVWVQPKRVQGGQALLQAHPDVNVIVCDDGLQHYALQRTIEIAVVQRPLGLGNARLLPAGPLREPLSRLRSVDVVVETGQLPPLSQDIVAYQLQLQPRAWTSVTDFSTCTSLEDLQQQTLVAIAGIGHPQRFFQQLSDMGLRCEQRVFADHHAYGATDFTAMQGKTILMTEKDAVKCQHLGLKTAWFLPVDAVLQTLGRGPSLEEHVISLLQQRKGNKQ